MVLYGLVCCECSLLCLCVVLNRVRGLLLVPYVKLSGFACFCASLCVCVFSL